MRGSKKKRWSVKITWYLITSRFILSRHAEKTWGEAIPKKAPLDSQGVLLEVSILPWTLLVPAASGKAVSSLSVRIILLPQKLVLRGPLLKFHSSLGMRDHHSHCHWHSLDTLSISTSRHNRSHYHFWECCLPITAKDAEMPLIFDFMYFQRKCGFIRPINW